jgi:hypothetical protein
MFFIQRCPTCGRRLRVCVEYLGMKIQCRHCRGTLVAHDPESEPVGVDPRRALMQRVDELLASPDDEFLASPDGAESTATT